MSKNRKILSVILTIVALFLITFDCYAQTAEEYYNHCGNSYKQGNLAQAVADCTQAISIDPYYTKAYVGRGLAYKDQGNLSQATLDFTHVIKIDPKNAYAYYYRGMTYTLQGDFTRSNSDYTKTIELNDPNINIAEAYALRATDLLHQGKFTIAIPDLTKAIEINPKYDFAYGGRELAYLMTKDYDRAWADVHKVEELGISIPNQSQFISELKKQSGREQ